MNGCPDEITVILARVSHLSSAVDYYLRHRGQQLPPLYKEKADAIEDSIARFSSRTIGMNNNDGVINVARGTAIALKVYTSPKFKLTFQYSGNARDLASNCTHSFAHIHLPKRSIVSATKRGTGSNTPAIHNSRNWPTNANARLTAFAAVLSGCHCNI